MYTCVYAYLYSQYKRQNLVMCCLTCTTSYHLMAMSITNSALCFLVGFEGHLESGREHILPDYSIYLDFFFSLWLWLSWLTPASPQGTARCPLASGARGGDVAAKRSAMRHPEGIELDSFHVAGSPDLQIPAVPWKWQKPSGRDPIKGPPPASCQQQMPQCPPLSSPVSPDILLQSWKMTPQFTWSSFLVSRPGSREAAAGGPGVISGRDGPGMTLSPTAFWRHLLVKSVPRAGPGACGHAGTSPWLCALPGREERNRRGKYFPLTSPLHDYNVSLSVFPL